VADPDDAEGHVMLEGDKADEKKKVLPAQHKLPGLMSWAWMISLAAWRVESQQSTLRIRRSFTCWLH